MPRDKEAVKLFIDALESEGFETRSYSGRGMYGKSCVAVTDVSAWEVAKALMNETHDGEFDDLSEPKQDSLGMGNVLYWPSYEWPKEESDADSQ